MQRAVSKEVAGRGRIKVETGTVADSTVGFQFEAALRVAGATAPEDASLLEGLRQGDEAAYEVLIQRYERPVYNLVSRLVEDRADAADAVQEVFLKVFRKVGWFRGESSLKTWIYRIAINEARNQRRWFGRHRQREVGLEPAPGESAGGYGNWLEDQQPSPFDIALDHETRALIEDALNEVSPAFRAALVLREIEGLSYEEISEILEVSLGTVKSRIVRGREALRRNLGARLDTCPALRLSLQPAD
jgi:RNA polymerase sigma-70 factor, ECF subfamily